LGDKVEPGGIGLEEQTEGYLNAGRNKG
jgi:hypothetical protein